MAGGCFPSAAADHRLGAGAETVGTGAGVEEAVGEADGAGSMAVATDHSVRLGWEGEVGVELADQVR